MSESLRQEVAQEVMATVGVRLTGVLSALGIATCWVSIRDGPDWPRRGFRKLFVQKWFRRPAIVVLMRQMISL